MSGWKWVWAIGALVNAFGLVAWLLEDSAWAYLSAVALTLALLWFAEVE